MLRLATLRVAPCFAARCSLVNASSVRLRPLNSALQPRAFSSSFPSFNELKPSQTPTSGTDEKPLYSGPLTQTFRRLKLFSLSSLTLSCTLAPFMFMVESNLPSMARVALVSIAIGTSGISTGLVGWCGQPYVSTLRYLKPEENSGAEGIQMTTHNLFLKPRITTVYDPAFLIETRRGFAKWELADSLVFPKDKAAEPGRQETVAETADKDGNVLGRWVVEWGEDGKGTCHEVGKIVRYFNVHEELLQ